MLPPVGDALPQRATSGPRDPGQALLPPRVQFPHRGMVPSQASARTSRKATCSHSPFNKGLRNIQ